LKQIRIHGNRLLLYKAKKKETQGKRKERGKEKIGIVFSQVSGVLISLSKKLGALNNRLVIKSAVVQHGKNLKEY